MLIHNMMILEMWSDYSSAMSSCGHKTTQIHSSPDLINTEVIVKQTSETFILVLDDEKKWVGAGPRSWESLKACCLYECQDQLVCSTAGASLQCWTWPVLRAMNSGSGLFFTLYNEPTQTSLHTLKAECPYQCVSGAMIILIYRMAKIKSAESP